MTTTAALGLSKLDTDLADQRRFAPGAGLLLSSIRRTCQRLWNDVHITAPEKRLAKDYYDAHQDDARRLHALNRRMGELITSRIPAHQARPTAFDDANEGRGEVLASTYGD